MCARKSSILTARVHEFGDGGADLVRTVLLDEMHSAHSGFGQVGPAPDELADAPASRAMAKDAEGLRGLLGLANREVAIAGVRSVAVTASSCRRRRARRGRTPGSGRTRSGRLRAR